jgi:hypothetical protein
MLKAKLDVELDTFFGLNASMCVSFGGLYRPNCFISSFFGFHLSLIFVSHVMWNTLLDLLGTDSFVCSFMPVHFVIVIMFDPAASMQGVKIYAIGIDNNETVPERSDSRGQGRIK